ncbi:isocitrate lyase/phosphoenolpyruvate mutase family protein [Streptomyces sp. NPDC057136]|uniref:isocitrate lyase/phosphoenolpyruvate mutase family protein n=1 Tax=Streptomyces sp. NPDC057136 TaxID=3346029 RepID=UPI003639D43F
MEPVREKSFGTGGATQLRELFARPGVVRIVGAHNPLGARLAERAGFDGVWSSGLEISASQGLPDTDLLTMAELLSVAGSMAGAVDVPVVADCDAGYGNALNVMHMIRRYERAGLAAVSIEDKVFPKVNSFIAGRQELAGLDEFCGKVEAAKSAQRGSDLMVIARIEALIAGHGMEEALQRGEAYAESGADAVLIHAKGSSPDPVLEFLRRWRLDLPVVVVPTTYHTITADELGAAGAKMVIYANHGLRAGINAVTEVYGKILSEGRSTGIEERIAPLATVFDLQGMAALKRDEERFVRERGPGTRAVIVPGAPIGAPRDPADDCRSGLARLRAAALEESGVADVVAAPEGAGHPAGDAAAALVEVPTGFAGRTVVSTDDVFADAESLNWLTTSTADIAVLVDVAARDGVPVALSSGTIGGRLLAGTGGHVVTALGEMVTGRAKGEFPGVAAFSARGFTALQQAAEKRNVLQEDRPVSLVDLLSDLIATGWTVRATGIAGGWTHVRSQEELRELYALVSEQVTA